MLVQCVTRCRKVVYHICLARNLVRLFITFARLFKSFFLRLFQTRNLILQSTHLIIPLSLVIVIQHIIFPLAHPMIVVSHLLIFIVQHLFIQIFVKRARHFSLHWWLWKILTVLAWLLSMIKSIFLTRFPSWSRSFNWNSPFPRFRGFQEGHHEFYDPIVV